MCPEQPLVPNRCSVITEILLQANVLLGEQWILLLRLALGIWESSMTSPGLGSFICARDDSFICHLWFFREAIRLWNLSVSYFIF